MTLLSQPISTIDLELSEPPQDITDLAGYRAVRALVHYGGVPIGSVQVPVVDGRCPASTLRRACLDQLDNALISQAVASVLTAPPRTAPDETQLFDQLPSPYDGPFPLVTVAVCTRDRAVELDGCLAALTQLDYPHLDLLVVDNASGDKATERLLEKQYRDVRYVYEPRPGLDNARNRAIEEARGEIIAFTDDDVRVDAGWVTAVVRIFTADPAIMAVTGLVAPYELETTAQQLFEEYGGFGRGFQRRWFRADYRRSGQTTLAHGGSGKFGTGANMAFRRAIFDQIGGFDPALDVGTPTNGGGDLDMFFRILKEGYTLVYEPAAVVYHRHRHEYRRLRTQIANNGIGLYAYFVRSALAYPEERFAFWLLGLWWFYWWSIRRLLGSLIRPSPLPRDLILAELWGSLAGLRRYQRARRAAGLPPVPARARPFDPVPSRTPPRSTVRQIDLYDGPPSLGDVTDYDQVHLFVFWNRRPLGKLIIKNFRRSISEMELRDRITDELGVRLLERWTGQEGSELDRRLRTAVADYLYLSDAPAADALPTMPPTAVSVVIATYDRPDDLRRCLAALAGQETARPVEVIVVDNHPASGLTPPVIADFPDVKLVSEPRPGLSYARNAGISASQGAIIVAIDDDIAIAPDWLERLVGPFSRSDVMIVTGNTLPLELEAEAQRLFELYGGLGRGVRRQVADRSWFDSFRFRPPPTWDLGATANAAFRATIFAEATIGLLDERLGAGSPTGCSEDTDLFYRVLRAGYTIVYEPTAVVWHRHRHTLPALRRQLYNYSKGHVAYHLLIVGREGDLRSLLHLLLWLPLGHLWRLKERLRGRTDYPISLNLVEMAGNLMGPWALWQAHRRARRLGRSRPYLAPHPSRPSSL